MSRVCVAVSWFVLLGMVAVFSALSFAEARSARAEKATLAQSLAESLRSYEKRFDLSRSELDARFRQMQGSQDSLRAAIEKLRSDRALSGSPGGDKPKDDTGPPTEGDESSSAEKPVEPNEDHLPPVPEGVVPEQFLRMEDDDLKAIVADSRYNPTGREPTRVEKLRMVAELRRASAQIEVLSADIRVTVADGMEKLRSRGEYIDYAPGERYQSSPGVLSASEKTEGGGTRIFYLQPQDFPELYAKKLERKKAAEMGVRRVLGELQPMSSPGADAKPLPR